jgi:MFS family permease
MSSVSGAIPVTGESVGILAKERTVAGLNFNRWLVPPAALAIHLCIGMAYGFSVFWLPMTKLLATTDASCKDIGWTAELATTTCNWSVPTVSFTFTLFIAFLGIAAAIWGGWLERVGPRKAGVVAAICWCGGMAIGAVGVTMHQLWIVWLGTGVLGGIGLGLGYISPVSTLIKWFPDRRGMATGFAIMGFGGGALIGSPLATALMNNFSTSATHGVAEAYLILAAVYFIYMLGGAFGYRVPPNGWRPANWTPATVDAKSMITRRHVHLSKAWKTPQFWCIWIVLCMNVSAGIGVLAMASPMFQDVFGGRLIGADPSVTLSTEQKAAIVVTVCVIMTMYGGGFATVPAYLADMFGTQMVGAIHGRLLTAWSVAGVIGPLLIANIRQFQLDHGVAKNLVYDNTLYILAGLLLVGLIANFLVKPVDEKYYMSDDELAAERKLAHEAMSDPRAETAARGSFGVIEIAAWLAVGIPFLIGFWIALQKAAVLFK